MNYKQDTIAALCTANGLGAIAVIRVSGANCFNVVKKVFKGKKADNLTSGTAVFGHVYDEDRFLDEAVVTYFKAPKSYTGENVAEISCHGNPYIVGQILKAILKHCRQAEKGEFTQRAYLNNKIDLTKAEAISELYKVQTQKAHSLVAKQLEGSLYKYIASLLQKLTSLRTTLELEIDFVEQGLETLDHELFTSNLQNLIIELNKLASSTNNGLIIKNGLKVVLAGMPNVGKSSIFNAFLKTERAIVTPHPGTTRDYIEEAFALDGYLIRLFDTAGLRIATDEVEKIGIERSKQMLETADVILYVFTGSFDKEYLGKLKQKFTNTKVIAVKNKCDDDFKISETEFIKCSSQNKNGLDNLKIELLKELKTHDESEDYPLLTNIRQQAAVLKAVESLTKAKTTFENDMGYEFTAFDMKEASVFLEEIVGTISTDDLLNNIFDNFCIGK